MKYVDLLLILWIQIWNPQIQTLKSTDFINQKYISFRLVIKYGLSGEKTKTTVPVYEMYERISPTAIQIHIPANPSAIQNAIMNMQYISGSILNFNVNQVPYT